MKKVLLISLTFLLFSTFINAQGYLWIKQSTGEAGIGKAEGQDVVCDNEGNTYVVGNFNNTVYFDSLQVSGNYGTMYVVKYDPAGNPVYVRQINGNSNNQAYGIAVDSEQNVYICGMYKQTNDNTILDFGNIQVTGNPSLSTFLAMIDKDGNWQWVNTILSQNIIGQQYCIPDEILITEDGNLYIAGSLNNTVSVEGNLYNTENGGDDAFYFTRFTTSGELTWFKSGRGIFTGIEFADTKAESIIFAGRADNTLKYANDSITGQGDADVVFGAIDQNGDLLWWQTAGHPSFNEHPNGIALDQNNNIYLAFHNPLWVKIGDLTIDYNGVADMYLFKFDEVGNFLWTQPLYSGSVEGANGIRSLDILTEPGGKTYVTGEFESPYYFGKPIFFTDTIGGYGHKECFIAAYNQDGSYADVASCVFAEGFDNGEFIPTHFVFDHEMNITMTGSFRDNITIDEVLLEAGPMFQMFVMKIKPDALFDFSSGIFNEFPDKIKLLIHPNPFTQSTSIEYELNQPETVQITIFNHLGKQVSFIQQNQSEGKQQITWDASGQPAGMYYFRMQAGEQVATGKLLLVR